VLHVLALAAVVAMVGLGSWQLRRLDDRRDRNDLVEARMAMPAAPVGELADPGDDPDELRFRAVTATGTYDEGTVSVRTTQGGVAGGWRYDLLALDAGESVWVLRGFGPTDDDGRVDAPAPPGAVAVEGIAVPIDRLPRPSRRAVEAVALEGVLPVVVQASAADAPLTPVPTPELDEGPHLSYAVQWFLFASVVVVGYPFLVRRRLRDGDGD
jgi:cytochrome oxidase assembly protein ShyY1